MDTLAIIENSEDLKRMWSSYQKQFAYAKDIGYEMVIERLKTLMMEEKLK